MDLSRVNRLLIFDSEENNLDMEAAGLWGNNGEPPAGLWVIRLAVAGSVEEIPFIARTAPNRIGTRLLPTQTCITVEEVNARRSRNNVDEEFVAVWAHLLTLGWMAKPG